MSWQHSPPSSPEPSSWTGCCGSSRWFREEEDDLGGRDYCTCDWLETVSDHVWPTCCETEEFIQDTQECVYCRGTGRVLREEATALIPVPVSDNRLQPRRTKWIVAISMVMTALFGIVIVFFVFPRQIEIEKVSPVRTVNAFIPTEEQLENGTHVNITFQHRFTLRNDNYMLATLTGLQYSVYYHQELAGTSVFGDVLLKARSTHEIEVEVNAYNLTTQFERMILRQCIYFPQQDKFEFRLNGTGQALGQGQQLYHFTSLFVNCRNTTV